MGFLFLFLLAEIPIASAGITGKIAGKVVDKTTGEPLPGVNIIVSATVRRGREIPLKQPMGAASNLNGEYFIINLPPGRYVVKASMIGYKSVTKTDVRVSVDYTTPLDFALEQEAIEMAEIVVSAKREVIRKDLTASAATVDAETIEMMPVTSINEVLDLQVGMVRDAGGQLHIRGGRSTEIAYMVDGVQVTDPLNRGAGLTIDNQAVEELQAITGTFNAEYGQALSGVINVVTKRGSDQFQGQIRTYFSDYLSFDDNVYYVMDDADWAHAAAEALTRDDKTIFYKNRVYTTQSLEMPHLTRKNYLRSYEPFRNQDLQANLSGPIPFTNKNFTFFASGRYYYNHGYQMGKRYFKPWGLHAPALDTLHTYDLPDNKLVNLGWDRNFSIQSKFFYRLSGSINISYGIYWYDHDYKYGSHYYKYNPDATKNYFDNSTTHILAVNHMLSSRTFYELRLSSYYKKHENYLYKDPYDYRYVPSKTADIEQYLFDKRNNPNVSLTVNPYDFAFWGNETDRDVNLVKYKTFKFDITSQVSQRHQVKSGVEARWHDLSNEWLDLQFSSDYKPLIMPISSPFHDKYHHKPRVFAAYIQDKAEFKEIIFNIGLRYDYFDSDGKILADPTDPQIYNPFNPKHIFKENPSDPTDTLYTVAEREKFWFKDVKPKHQLSPRLGIAFPITDRGVIHFSYGHFFQTPAFNYLYANPEFEIYGAGTTNLIGNADLNAERTVIYEIGLQQALSDNFHFSLTGFYRDIRDWIGTSPPIDTYGGRTTYVKYVNKDYGSAQGVELSAEYRSRNFMMNLDYTFMAAEGTTSNPQDAYNDLRARRAPRIQMVPLNWDRTHTLNAVLTYTQNGFVASLISQIYSGFPYTPTFARGEVAGSGQFSGLRENSERQPTTYNFDLRLSKEFRFGRYRFEIFTNIYNIFDRRNVNHVFTDTGRADYTLEGINQQHRVVAISDVDEYFAQPGMFAPPRQIQWGITLGF